MTNKTTHAGDSALHELVFGDEASDAYTITAAHVETCETCQNRLSQLFNGEDVEREASKFLSDYPFSEAPTHTLGHEHADQTVSLDFLSPPSHPEMLGRLGRYEIERVIGRGGMGVVLKAFDTELNRPVAVKVLAKHLAHSGAARQRFAREAKAAAAVVHEHVVAIHDVEIEGDCPYLVMRYVAGESLQSRVDREGPLEAKKILRIGMQAAAGLAAAHEQGVIHRDVKPANILLENGVERVLLTDFGLARTVDDASLTHTGIVSGTPHYMSPEQANGECSDHGTDLFSLGLVLYFMATGYPPFRAERAMGVLHRICNDRHRPVWEVNPDIPDELSNVIDRLLEKKPTRRFASAAVLRDALATALDRIQRPRSRWTRPARRCFGRHRNALSLLAAGAILTGMFVAFQADWTSNVATNTDSTSRGHNTATRMDEELANQNANALDHSLAEIQSRLSKWDSPMDGRFANPTTSDWSDQVQSIKQRLDRLEENAGSQEMNFQP